MGFYTEKDIEIERLREENARLKAELLLQAEHHRMVLLKAGSEERAALSRDYIRLEERVARLTEENERLRSIAAWESAWQEGKDDAAVFARERDEARAENALLQAERDTNQAELLERNGYVLRLAREATAARADCYAANEACKEFRRERDEARAELAEAHRNAEVGGRVIEARHRAEVARLEGLILDWQNDSPGTLPAIIREARRIRAQREEESRESCPICGPTCTGWPHRGARA